MATHALPSSTTHHQSPPNNADAEAVMHDSDNGTAPLSKKRKSQRRENQIPRVLYQATFRKPIFSYFHIVLVTPGLRSSSSISTSTSTSNIDPLLALQLLSSPLQAYLGTTGAAIPIDILKTLGRGVWIRIARQDARGVRAALSGWIGACEGNSIPGMTEDGRVRVAWRVVGEAGTLGGVDAWHNGVGLFGE